MPQYVMVWTVVFLCGNLTCCEVLKAGKDHSCHLSSVVLYVVYVYFRYYFKFTLFGSHHRRNTWSDLIGLYSIMLAPVRYRHFIRQNHKSTWYLLFCQLFANRQLWLITSNDSLLTSHGICNIAVGNIKLPWCGELPKLI